MIADFATELFRPWCVLYRFIAVDNEARLTNLLQQTKHNEIQLALNEVSNDLSRWLCELNQTLSSLEPTGLLLAYACLRELETAYRAVPWRHRRGGATPEVELDGHRYILRSPPQGYIVAAVSRENRFTPAEEIGRDRVLGLRYRWLEISDETSLDWDYSLVLDALLADDRLRVGLSPIAGASEMHWHSNTKDRRGPRGEVPMRCLNSNHAKIWSRVEAALEAAYAAEVHLLLFPELVMTEDLLAGIMRWLGTRNLTNPVIRLVVAGTRHVDADNSTSEFCNRCTVLDAAGKVVWEQDKRHGFTLEAEDLLPYFPDFDAPAGFEPTQVSAALVVRETAIGRILNPICLDYINEDIWAKLGGDLHLIPAMSPGLSRFRDRGRQLGNLSGATSLVVNARPSGETGQRLVAYVPSKSQPEIVERTPDLFTLDIAFNVS